MIDLKDDATPPSSKTFKIKQRITQLLHITSAHGFSRLLKCKNIPTTLIWLFFLINSTLIGSYIQINILFDYLKYETTTNIRVVTESQSQFPTISFCNKIKNNNNNNITILSFKFDAIEYNLSSLIEQFIDLNGRQCCQFNSGNLGYIYNSTTPGFNNGLRLNLYLNIPNAYDYNEIILFVYNHSSLPPPLLLDKKNNNNGYWLKPGSWNYFEIDRVFNEQLDEPYNDCLKDLSKFKFNKILIDYINLKLKRIYTQKYCFYLCSIMPSLNLTLDNNTNCVEYCPLECDSMSYIINTYNEQLPNKGIINETSKNDNGLTRFRSYEQVNKHFIGIRVYYRQLKYTIVSQTPKLDFYSLVSQIGANFGLFWGISFLSFAELIEIFFEIILILISD